MPSTSWSTCDTVDDLLKHLEEMPPVDPRALYCNTGIDPIGLGTSFLPFSGCTHHPYPATPPISPTTMTAIGNGVSAFDPPTASHAFLGTFFALQQPDFEPAQTVQHLYLPPSTPNAAASASSSQLNSALDFVNTAQPYMVSSSKDDLVKAALLPLDLILTVNNANRWAGRNGATPLTAAMPEIQQPQPLSPPTTSTAALTSHPIFVGATNILSRNNRAILTAEEPAAFHDELAGAVPRNHAGPSVSRPIKRARTFRCQLCDHASFRKQEMQRHRATRHRMLEDLKFACAGCGTAFGRRDSCRRHVTTGLKKGTCPKAEMPPEMRRGRPKGASTLRKGMRLQKGPF